MPPYEVATGDVLKWLAAYDGDRFHALLCDPPYHLVAIVKRFAKTARTEATVGGAGAYQRHAAGFMGQTWDGGDIAFRPETWAAFLPVLHPGAFGIAFAGSRGWHRLAVAIEDAGYVIHPSIFGWLYGSGFPKATRIDTQIDRAAGAERPVVGFSDPTDPRSGGRRGAPGGSLSGSADGTLNRGEPYPLTVPATDLAKTWEHHRYGLQALKPALEPFIVFQKPYDGHPIDDITRTGAGALDIDGARLTGLPEATRFDPQRHHHDGYRMSATDAETFAASRGRDGEASAERTYEESGSTNFAAKPGPRGGDARGRWPANFALGHAPGCVKVGEEGVPTGSETGRNATSGFGGGFVNAKDKDPIGFADADGLETVERWACVPECPVRRLNDQAGQRTSGQGPVIRQQDGGYGRGWSQGMQASIYGDTGYASRFFFTAVEAALDAADVVRYEEKAAQEERERGLLGVFRCLSAHRPNIRHDGDPLWTETHFVLTGPVVTEVACRRNPHPTVKPVDLMRWLARLLLPPDAYAPRRILIPFAGVGSEMIAAKQAGWEAVVGVELHEHYAEVARARLAAWIGMM